MSYSTSQVIDLLDMSLCTITSSSESESDYDMSVPEAEVMSKAHLQMMMIWNHQMLWRLCQSTRKTCFHVILLIVILWSIAESPKRKQRSRKRQDCTGI